MRRRSELELAWTLAMWVSGLSWREPVVKADEGGSRPKPEAGIDEDSAREVSGSILKKKKTHYHHVTSLWTTDSRLIRNWQTAIFVKSTLSDAYFGPPCSFCLDTFSVILKNQLFQWSCLSLEPYKWWLHSPSRSRRLYFDKYEPVVLYDSLLFNSSPTRRYFIPFRFDFFHSSVLQKLAS